MANKKIDFIKQELLKTGFPLEMEVSSFLRKKNYDVFSSCYFYDRDEEKIREFDIEAIPVIEDYPPEENWSINPSLAIECKKSEVSAWVFFKSHPIEGHFDIGHSIDLYTEKLGYDFSACQKLLLSLCSGEIRLHYWTDTVANSFQQIRLKSERGVKGKNEILDATSKVIKFIDYRLFGLKKSFAPDSDRHDIIFYFPIIVFDGALYEASFGKKGLEIKGCDHFVVETNYLSSVTKSLVPMYIDVIQKSGLKVLIQKIEKEIQSMIKCLANPILQKQLSSISKRL